MSKRDWKVFIEDMLESIDNIHEYTQDLRRQEFLQRKMVKDAVVRNLEIIGEAANQVPGKIQRANPEINWKDIIGLRNIVIHHYFGVDYTIVWTIITDDLQPLREKLNHLLANSE